jgi:hypothetical protein
MAYLRSGFVKGKATMVGARRLCFVAFSNVILALTGAGCGGPGVPVPESLTREAKLDGMTVTLEIKDEKAPELNWAVTDRVIADFSGHRVEVEKKQVTLDGVTKKLPANTQNVTIQFENDKVSIRANETPLFGPQAK